jgi:hypothetical protein
MMAFGHFRIAVTRTFRALRATKNNIRTASVG